MHWEDLPRIQLTHGQGGRAEIQHFAAKKSLWFPQRSHVIAERGTAKPLPPGCTIPPKNLSQEHFG